MAEKDWGNFLNEFFDGKELVQTKASLLKEGQTIVFYENACLKKAEVTLLIHIQKITVDRDVVMIVLDHSMNFFFKDPDEDVFVLE